MNITFFGQLGLPKLRDKDRGGLANRIEAVARQLVADRHEVTVFGTAPYLSSGNYHGIDLQRRASLNPEKPGGWVYLVFCLISMVRRPVDVIHIHSYRAALLLSLTRFLFPHARVVWTIDAIPRWNIEFRILNLGIRHMMVTTPSRTVQYRLLVEHGVKATYIPDGYHQPVVPPIPVTRFGLRAGQYCVALVDSPEALRVVAKAYAAAKSRKKLVVLQLETSSIKRLRKKYPFLVFLDSKFEILNSSLTPRVRRSLIAGAAAVIVGDNTTSPSVLLEAMDAKRAIIAINEPRYQETLGTAGQYFAAKDSKGLTAALRRILADATAQSTLGQAAATRAERHFTWPRLVEDYHTFYAPVVRPVLLDSAYLVQFSPSKVR
jgi:glycosyltransferase involved in cell wall biosynthesis